MLGPDDGPGFALLEAQSVVFVVLTALVVAVLVIVVLLLFVTVLMKLDVINASWVLWNQVSDRHNNNNNDSNNI